MSAIESKEAFSTSPELSLVERLKIWDDPGEIICAQAALRIEALEAALRLIAKGDCICCRAEAARLVLEEVSNG